MENQKSKSFNYYMRSLHRDIGFFIIGITVIFTLSGIMLIYRDTDFLKTEVKNQKELAPGLDAAKLGENLRMREVKITKTEGDIVYFQNGSYNTVSGHAEFTVKTAVFPLNKFMDLHKTMTKKASHYFIALFAGSLFFLAISSFWMFKPKTKTFRRGIILSVAGFVVAFLLLFIA
jgi:hypothetical protein